MVGYIYRLRKALMMGLFMFELMFINKYLDVPAADGDAEGTKTRYVVSKKDQIIIICKENGGASLDGGGIQFSRD